MRFQGRIINDALVINSDKMDAKSIYGNVIQELERHISGNKDILKLMFISLVADGHALLEGVPGVAKTTMTKALASAIDADFKRVQCTADLDISDIIGTTFVDEQRNIKLKKGPVFTNILLADELNRAPVKTMSGFLEVLEERRVTIGGEDLPLPKPFIAFATQNPLTIEGTTPIPKVLADRFLMRISVGYPTESGEEEYVGEYGPFLQLYITLCVLEGSAYYVGYVKVCGALDPFEIGIYGRRKSLCHGCLCNSRHPFQKRMTVCNQ